jgi:hypothetical protein
LEAKSLHAVKESFRARVRRRLIRAIGALHPDVELVRVKAWPTNEPAGERWVADERRLEKGGYDAYLVILKKPGKPSNENGRDDRI